MRVNNAKKFKTNVAYETLTPVWNESVSIAMPQEGDKISFVSPPVYPHVVAGYTWAYKILVPDVKYNFQI